MNSHAVPCPSCKLPLPASSCNHERVAPCPSCRHRIQVQVFPALFRSAAASKPAERILEEGVSNCFYHETNKAVIPCDTCGRFLCSLCHIQLNQQNLCPTCLRNGTDQGKIETLDTSRWIWDSAALSIALLPLIVWPVTLITAPTAVVWAIISFFRPSSLVPRSRIRAYLALFFGLAQLAGWIAGGIAIYTAASRSFAQLILSPQLFC